MVRVVCSHNTDIGVIVTDLTIYGSPNVGFPVPFVAYVEHCTCSQSLAMTGTKYSRIARTIRGVMDRHPTRHPAMSRVFCWPLCGTNLINDRKSLIYKTSWRRRCPP